MRPQSLSAALAALTAVLSAGSAMATGPIVWDESVQGDLSGNKALPTVLPLSTGSNLVEGTIQSGDIDYVTILVPAGRELSGLVMVDYAGKDGIAFIAVQSGTVFTEGPSASSVNIENLLGYSLFGTNVQNLGADILPEIGQGFGAQGFTGSLPSGSYTFWIQQTGASTSYTFDFQVVPAPASAVVLAASGVLAARRRRR